MFHRIGKHRLFRRNRRQQLKNKRRASVRWQELIFNGLEPLESRVMMDVTASFVTATGALTVGDSGTGTIDNKIEIIDPGAGVEVRVNNSPIAITTDGLPPTAATVNSITLNAGNGNDTIVLTSVAAPTWAQLGSAGGDISLTAGDGNDVVLGSQFADIITGDNDNDTITGDDGNDTIDGGFGDDLFIHATGLNAVGGDGSDRIDGGVGVDTLTAVADLAVINETFTLTLNGGTSRVELAKTTATVYTISTSTVEAVNLSTNDGNDSISVGNVEGSDLNRFTVNGGAGNDTVNVDTNTAIVSANISTAAGADTIAIAASEQFTALSVDAGADNDTVTLGASANLTNATLETGDGDDSLAIGTTASLGTTSIGGGAQNDTVTVGASATASTLIVNTGNGNNSVTLGDSLTAGTGSLLGGAGDDTFSIGIDSRVTNLNLDAGGGADRLNIAESFEVSLASLAGGTGNDTFNFGDSFGDPALSPQQTSVTLAGGGGDDLVSFGSGSLMDTVVFFGDDNNDTFSFGAGSSVTTGSISGGNGDDRVIFGDGASLGISFGNGVLLDGNDGVNTLDYTAYTTNVVVTLLDLPDPGLATATGGVLRFDSILGGSGNDTLTGNSLANTLIGNAGNDSLTGGGGDDLVEGGSGNDTVVYNDGDGSDTLTGGANLDVLRVNGSLTADDFSLTANGTRAELSRTVPTPFTLDVGEFESLNVAASDGLDTLTIGNLSTVTDLTGIIFTGGDGDDLLDARNMGTSAVTLTATGDGGFDSLFGGPGNDSLSGGADDDSVSGEAGNDQLLGGDGHDILLGGTGADSFLGGEGNDSITGGEGNDTLNGEGGTNTFFDSLAVVVDPQPVVTLTNATSDANGTDSLVSIQQAQFIGTNANNTINALAFSGQVTLIGGAGNDSIVAGNGGASLIGSEGNDSLVGGLVADLIVGDTGSQTVFLLNNNNQLLVLDITAADPGNITSTITIPNSTGNPASDLIPGEFLVGIDFRPVNGLLYAVSDLANLYTVDTVTGLADFIGAIRDSNGDPVVIAGAQGVDFNPVADRLRIVTSGGQNLRINPDPVTINSNLVVVATVDGTTPGDTTAAAYTNNFAGAQSTTLIVIDTVADVLNIQTPPNDGTQVEVDPLGVDAEDANGFDIAALGGTGLAALTVAGNASLYSLDLRARNDLHEIQRALFIDLVGDGSPVIRGLAFAPGNGNDSVAAGDGADTLAGGGGNDTMFGDLGNDFLHGANGANSLLGGFGNDTILAGDGNDTLNGDTGTDLLFGLSNTNSLLRFSRLDPGTIIATIPVTGLIGSDNLFGIDFRPSDGLLYGLGFDGSAARIYTINTTSGAATMLSTLNADPADATNPFAALSGSTYGFDFNPVADRLRLVSNNEQNFRVDVDNGRVITDEGITPAGDIAAAAYTSSFATASSTLLYTIDPVAGVLNLQDPPNDGFQAVIGSLQLVNITGDINFDIHPLETTVGLASINVGGTTGLYSINLLTGQASILGVIGTGATPLRGLAIIPTDGDDSLFAGNGDNTLFGGAGLDTLIAGTGNDSLDGGLGNDTLNSGAGNNLLDGDAGHDTLQGGTGNDTFIGGFGNDSVLGDTGTDLFDETVTVTTVVTLTNNSYNGNGVDSLSSIDLARITATTGDDTVTAATFSGPTTLLGGEGNDSLIGGTAADSILGELGDDTVTGGAGDDLLSGGEGGADVVVDILAGANAILTNFSNTANGTDAIPNDIERAFLTGNVLANHIDAGAFTGLTTLLGEAGNDTILGGTNNDSLLGGADNDSLLGGGFADTLLGGTGSDTMSGGTEDDLFVWNNGDGSDTLDGDGGFDISQVNGSTGNDAFAVNSANSRVSFQRSNLTPFTLSIGSVENVEANGGTGNDTITTGNLLSAGGDLVQLNLNGDDGNDVVDALAMANTLVRVIATGGAGNDSLRGTNNATQPDLLMGGDDSDTLTSLLGDDTLDGGEGGVDFDVASETLPNTGGSATLTDDNFTGLGNKTLIEIEQISIRGGAGNDFLDASAVLNTGVIFDGGGGNDQILGGQNNDTLIGGAGNDAIIGNGGDDLLIGGLDTDTINGGFGNDTLRGGGSVDIMDGGAGGDLADFSDSALLITGKVGDDGVVTVNGDNTESFQNMEGIIGSAFNDKLTGSSRDDSLLGGGGDDAITDKLGSNYIDGGDGNDALKIGTGNNTIFGGGGNDNIAVKGGFNFIDGGEGNDVFKIGAGNDTIFGGGGNDNITDKGGSNVIDGGDGNDTIKSGKGQSIVNGGAGDDLITGGGSVTGGLGNDMITGGKLADTLDGGGGNDTVRGGAGDDAISGDQGDDQLFGDKGNDSVNGGLGNDVISGGQGFDLLIGGGGINVFIQDDDDTAFP